MEESSINLCARAAMREDAAAITEIYNQGIEDRIATFETEPRAEADILPWFDHALVFVSVTGAAGEVVGYAVAHPYSDRPCYAGIGAFSVYVGREARGRGVGQLALAALIDAARARPLETLLARLPGEPRQPGPHGPHGLQADRRAREARQARGVWKDCVNVERLIPENIT